MRTDIHRPSEINPDDYQFVAFGYLGGSDLDAIMAMRAETEIRIAHMKRTGGRFADVEIGGGCMVCGNNRVAYVSHFYHEATNSYLRIGWQCAEKLEMAQGQNANAFKKAISDAREAKAGKAKAQAILSDMNLAACWTLYEADYDSAFRFEENTIRDIVGKLVTYGSISDKQEAFLRKLLDQLDRREDIDAERAAEVAAAKPAPEGRIEVTGKVLAVKFPENDFGRIDHKMLVQHADGWKLWVTVPAAIDKVERGATVSFTATVTPSNDDPKFAFGKRPTKATIVDAGPNAKPDVTANFATGMSPAAVEPPSDQEGETVML